MRQSGIFRNGSTTNPVLLDVIKRRVVCRLNVLLTNCTSRISNHHFLFQLEGETTRLFLIDAKNGL